MATELRLRGGTTAQHASFTGATKEITVDTTKNTVVVHNGSTAGGVPLATESNLTSEINSSVHAPGTGLPNELDALAAVKGGNTGALTIGTNDATNLTLETNNTARVTVNSAGNVGIGTSSPTQSLALAASSNFPFIHFNRFSDNEVIASIGWHGGGGGDFRIATETAKDISIRTNGAERMLINSAGQLKTKVTGASNNVLDAYACRAWVNFSGTVSSDGTNRLIRGSGNVSSVVRDSAGVYTVNFLTAMPDTNYTVLGTSSTDPGNVFSGNADVLRVRGDFNFSVSSVQVVNSFANQTTSGTVDRPVLNVAIFR